MKLKALCFVALLFAALLISSATTETSKDGEKSEAVATDKSQDQVRAGNFEEGKHYCGCCGKKYCSCCHLDDAKQAETVTEQNQAAEGTTENGRGKGRGGGRGKGGGGRRCPPYCTAEEVAEMARGGKP